MKKKLLTVVGIVTLLGSASYAALCPCGPVPGLWIAGEAVSEPVTDWGFVNDAGLCQLQVWTWKPHALNLNCMSSQGQLYVSCSNCAGKTWSNSVGNAADGKILVNNNIYPIQVTRVTDADELDRAWSARSSKLNIEPPTARPDHWWSFRLQSNKR